MSNQTPTLSMQSSFDGSSNVVRKQSAADQFSASAKDITKPIAISKQDKLSVSMESLKGSIPKVDKEKEKEREKRTEKESKKLEKEREKMDKKIEKLGKEFEKMDKDREKKENERDKSLEKQIEKIEKERDKVELVKDKLEREGKDRKEVISGQKTRLHELFGQIEKEFELLWEENQELRRKLEDVRQVNNNNNNSNYGHNLTPIVTIKREGSHTSISSKLDKFEKSRLNPLKKKEREQAEWERITTFVGHRDGITDLSSCKWEKNSFATASADRTARVWSSDSFNPVYIYIGHKGAVNTVRLHPSNRLALTASGDSSCHIWRVPKPNEKDKNSTVIKEDYRDTANKPWAPLLASTNEVTTNNQEITTNETQQQQQQQTTNSEARFGVIMINRALFDMKHKNHVIASDWLAPGDRFVSVSYDNLIKIWSLENGRHLNDIDAGMETSAYITNLTTHSNLPLFMCCSSDTHFRVYDIRSQNPLINAVQGHSDVVTSAIFSPIDENIIISGSDDRTVKIWDRRSLRSPRTVIRCSNGINRFAVSPLSSHLVIPMDDSRTKVCDLSGKQLGRLKSESKHRHRLLLSCAAWSGDESVIFTAGWDKSVIAWAQPRQNMNKSTV